MTAGMERRVIGRLVRVDLHGAGLALLSLRC